MKKLLQMKFMLLLCALIVGSGTMWAETEVLSWSRSGTTNTYTTGYTFSATASAKSGYYQDASSGTAGIKLYSENNAICDKTPTSVTFTASVGGGSANKDLSNSVYVCYVDKSGNVIGGTETVVTNKITTAGGDTYNISMSTAKATNAYGVYIYHTKESGYNVRYFSFSLSYVASSGTTYSITAESNNESFGTVSLSGNVITGSPNTGYRYADPAYTVAPENSATVVQDGNTFTVTPTANTTITINFEAIPTHTATFSVNGTTTTTDFQEGAAITFPANPADIEGKSFVGWTETAISGTTDEKPTFVTSATMGEADVTYYAVFAEIEGESGWFETALSNIATTDIFVFSNGSYAMSNDNGTSSAPAAVAITVSDGKITSVVADNLKWNVSGDANNGYTFYPNGSTNTLYCTTTAGSGSNNNIRVGTGNRKLWIFDGDNYLVTNDNSTDRYLSIYNDQDFRGYINTDLAFVPKFYKYSEGSYSGYCTTVAADTREEAGLSFTESTATVEWYSANQYTGQALTNPHSVSPITWTSSNEGVATVENGTVTVLALGETTIKASFDGDNKYKKGEASYTLTVQDTREEPTVTINHTFITHTDVHQGTAAGHLTASVKYNDETIEGATVTWSGDNDAVATINATSGSVDLVAPGTVTFTAAYAGNEYYSAKTATYEMTVTDSYAPGTVNNPYTVAEARAAIDAGTGLTNVYATGIVSQTGTLSNGAISYYISDDGTTTDQLQAYNGKGIGGANFTSADDIQLGDIVVIKGNLKKYNSIYEFDSGNELVSLVRKPAAPTFSPAAGTYTSTQYVTISAAEGAAIYYTTDGTSPTTESNLYSEPIEVNTDMTIKAIAVKDSEISTVATAEYVINLTPSIVFDGEQNPANVTYTAGETNIHYVASNVADLPTIVICDNEGNQASYDWFSAEVTSDVYVHVTWQANTDTENSRTAYFKLISGATESEIFEFTQAKYAPDYATLPFEFDGGLNDIESTSGLTQNGLGTDYSSKPKLRFDNTGDYLVLKIDEAPGKLTFDIKGNSFSGGTFKVQTSADGETFTDLASYTSIGSDTETKEFDDLDADVRYIKWIYTSKSSGNVGLGNIKLAKLSTDPVIRLAETSVEVDAKQHDGTIALTYKNLQIDSMDDFDVQFYSDEQGTVTADAPEWVEALVAEQDPSVGPGYVLSYVIDANDGAARTAYLRVNANDGVNSVASDVVTITQAKFVKTTTYTLAHAITPGKHYVIASGDVGTVYVMGEQSNTNRVAVSGAEVNFSEVLSVTEDIAADVREFIISKDGNYYTIFDESESGYLFASSTSANHLKTQATNNANGQWTITIDEEGVATLKANMTGRNWMRFNESSKVFSCYGENSNQQDIYLFEKDNDEGSLVIPIAAACTDGTKCCATFSSTKPFVVPENLTVSEIGIDTDGTMNVVNYDAGAVVPANTGVMVSAAVGDRSYVANVSTEVGNNVLNGDNRLRPTGDNGLTATEMTSDEPETCKFYRLTMHDGTKLGFWWGADGGLSFDIAANKAYLAVPASVAGARNGFAFGDDATGISQIENGKLKIENYYDLQGRKVSKPGKGLYIVNGKKVVIK